MANPYALDFNPLASAISDNQQLDLARNRLAMDQQRLGFEAERLGFERDQHPLRLQGLQLSNKAAQHGITREEKTLPLDLQGKALANSGQGLQNQGAVQNIEAKRRELEKDLYGRTAAIAQMIEGEPDEMKRRDMLGKFYSSDPRIKQNLSQYLPKEVIDDPVVAARYMRAVAQGYQAPQTMNLGPDHTVVAISRDPNDPTKAPTARTVFKADGKHDVPAGYEKDPTKPGGLRPIAGGPADKITGEQAARTALIVGGIENMPKIRSIFVGTPGTPTEDAKPGALGSNVNPLSYGKQLTGIGDVGEGQRLMASAMEGVLRALTGAAATKEEVAREVTKYLPLAADTNETRQRKLDLFEGNLRKIAQMTAHGTSGTDILAKLRSGEVDSMKMQDRVQSQAAPKVGEIRKGHVFLGGDPAAPASWAKVNQ